MFDPEILAFAALATLLTMTPGADTMLLFRNVLRGGRGAGALTAFGGRFGLVVHALLSALGLSAVVAHSALAYDVLKVLGAGYLVWLGIKTALGSTQSSDPLGGGEEERGGRGDHPFLEGFLTNVLNPKTAIFYLAILPQFVRPEDSVLSRSLLLCALHVLVSLVWYLALCWLFSSARRILTRPPVRRALNVGSGLALAALGLRLALSSR